MPNNELANIARTDLSMEVATRNELAPSAGFDLVQTAIPRELVLSQYAATLLNIVDDGMKFQQGAVAALRIYKGHRRTFTTNEERLEGLQRLVTKLAQTYGIRPPTIVPHGPIDSEQPGEAYFDEGSNAIITRGALALMPVLRGVCSAIYLDAADPRRQAKWSVNLFRKVFPEEFAAMMTFQNNPEG